MKTIYVKKTYSLDIEGKPEERIQESSYMGVFGVSPSRIEGLKPKLVVQKGDSVKVGSPLFHDKKDMDHVFVSPVSGVVKEIKLGERRALDAVLIESDGKDQKEALLKPVSVDDISTLESSDLRKTIQKSEKFLRS